MADATEVAQPSETVPYDLIIAELESALHSKTMECVMLRARLATRDRQAAQATAMAPAVTSSEPTPEGVPDAAR